MGRRYGGVEMSEEDIYVIETGGQVNNPVYDAKAALFEEAIPAPWDRLVELLVEIIDSQDYLLDAEFD